MKPVRQKHSTKGLLTAAMLLCLVTGLTAQIPEDTGNRASAYGFLHHMWRGANFMASKIEGGYYSTHDFRLLAQNHFTHCRIGAKLDQSTGEAPDFTVDPKRLDNIRKAVDLCLEAGLVAIVDPLHTYNQGYTDADLPALKKIWQQVATCFADYPTDSVAFEIMNEPHNGVNLYDIVHESIGVIRSVPGNEKRIIIVSGQGFSTRQALINAFNDNIFPAGDTCLIGTFHYYDPKSFTKQGTFGETAWWGEEGDDDPDWKETEDKFDEVVAANSAWAQRHNTVPLPVYLGEFGVDNICHQADLKRWLFWVRVQAEKRGYASAVWNMYSPEGSGKGIGPWGSSQKDDPSTRYLRKDPVEALMTRYELEEGSLTGDAVADSDVAGFSGTGYVRFAGTEGSVSLGSVYLPKSGTYELYMRYQNPSAGEQSLTIKVFDKQGQAVLTETLKGFTFTGTDTWNTIRFTLSLPADTALQFEWEAPDPSSGILLDYFAVTKGEYYDLLFPSGEIITSVSSLTNPAGPSRLVQVYPTVFREEIHLKKTGTGDIFYNLTDMSGKIWIQGILREERKQITCGFLPAGVFLFFFISGNHSQTSKVIKF